MYTMAIVDDEKYALSDVRHTFPFKAYDFSLVAALTAPRQALAMLPGLHPDVVIVDIRMPEISGLELIRRLKPSLPDCVFVILSGYSEFEYAKSAIGLEVFDYLLKPFDEDDAEELLERLVAHLARRREQSHLIQEEPVPSVHSNQQFNKLLSYVDHHVYEPLSLEKLAEDHFLSANYCSQLFKSATGKTFSNYVRDKRIVRAKELLEKSAMSITDVAAAVGYDDIHYFTRIFSTQVGMPPRKYRSENKTEHD